MDNITTRLNRAKNLYRQSNYTACERLYRELFYKDQDAFDRDDRTFFLYSINEVGIKGNFSSADLEEQEKFILENFSQEDCSSRTFKDPYALIFLNMSGTYNKKRNYLKAITTLWNLKPDLLSSYNSPKGRGFDYSPRERWYFNLIESLIGLEKYEDALDYAERSLEDIKGSKSEAPIWIRYKSAKACQFMGEYPDALDFLNDIVKVKKDYYIYLRIASCHYSLGNNEDALEYAARAALANRSIQNSIGTYSLLADILERLERTEESMMHLYLIFCYKKAKGESIDYRLAQKVRDAGLDVENTNFRKVQKGLIPLWNELKYENARRYSGSIEKVFDRDRYGFISNDFDSGDTFFSFNDFNDSEDFIYPGTKVSFYLEDSFDKRKGKVSPKAVEIEVIL